MTYTNNQYETFVMHDLFTRARNGDNQASRIILEHIRIERQIEKENKRRALLDDQEKELSAGEHLKIAQKKAPQCTVCHSPIPAWIGTAFDPKGGICLNCETA